MQLYPLYPVPSLHRCIRFPEICKIQNADKPKFHKILVVHTEAFPLSWNISKFKINWQIYSTFQPPQPRRLQLRAQFITGNNPRYSLL
jgi:hypothetical protein